MKLAICAPFMESDLWQERLRRAAPRAALEFDEFYCPEEIRSVPGFRYDAGVVAMKGARGLELATALRERSAALCLHELLICTNDHLQILTCQIDVIGRMGFLFLSVKNRIELCL